VILLQKPSMWTITETFCRFYRKSSIKRPLPLATKKHCVHHWLDLLISLEIHDDLLHFSLTAFQAKQYTPPFLIWPLSLPRITYTPPNMTGVNKPPGRLIQGLSYI
jgi:hypothetical protein